MSFDIVSCVIIMRAAKGAVLKKTLLAIPIVLCCMASTWAASVYVVSVARNEVQVVVNGSKTYRLRPGESTPEGVRLTEILKGAAVLEVDGKPVTMGLGHSTVAETQIRADRRGQFTTTAYINGVAMESLIDTGASAVSLNRAAAQRLGINLDSGKRVMMQTANGVRYGTLVTLPRVQIGTIILENVEGAVTDGGPEQLGIVLVGMSFLRHVEMRHTGSTLTLVRAHY
jgi:aspartyl protease family protein